MTDYVRFRTAAGEYAIAVSAAREVRQNKGLRPLPSPLPGIAGLTERDGIALSVLDALGAGDNQMLVLEFDGQLFGLLVAEVRGVASIDERLVSPPPPGQDADVIRGAVTDGEVMVLIVDEAALLARFRP